MIQYVLTGLAGLVIGIVLMRVLNGQGAATPEAAGQEAASDAQAEGEAPAQSPKQASSKTLLIAAGALVAIGGAAYLLRGEEQGTASVSPVGMAGKPASALDDVDSMIGKLEARLAKSPEDGEGFRMLGWSYANTGKPERAIEPYRKAMALLPKRADVHAGYGEALVGAAKGKVTPEAMKAFDDALRLNPAEPRALYFKALHMAQNGQEKAALDAWITLANQGAADAPWQADVRQQIDKLSAKLGVDVSSRLRASGSASGARAPTLDSATVSSISALPAGDRSAMIAGMVDGLAQKLKADPRNPEGWARLLRSRMVLGDATQARADLAIARKALADDKAGLTRVNEAARELGVPGA